MSDERRMHLKSIGSVYLPERIAEIVPVDAPLRLFGPKELNQLNKIFNHLRKGGIAVASGQWARILDVFGYLERKKREFATVRRPPTKEERRSPTYRRRPDHWYERHYQRVLAHVMVIAYDDRLPYIEPDMHIPHLFQLLGEQPGANNGLPFLVPVSTIQKIQSDMEQFFYVPALEAYIVALSNVLQPLSQDTIELFHEGLQGVEVGDNDSPLEVLDMGCGCGVLALLAAQVFADYEVKITATDILPEAIATTRINVRNSVDMGGLSAPDVIETTDSGNLFEPVENRRYDLIIFNAPWVVAHPQSRAELAICDADQNTVRRFLNEAPRHLGSNGHIILGYSDHSGQTALENLQSMIEEAGLRTRNVIKRRVQTRSQKRKWEAILVYDLSPS
jgi:methylase of polypeptide subunit release factors